MNFYIYCAYMSGACCSILERKMQPSAIEIREDGPQVGLSGEYKLDLYNQMRELTNAPSLDVCEKLLSQLYVQI